MFVVEILECTGRPNEENPLASTRPTHCGHFAAGFQPSGLEGKLGTGGRWGRSGSQEAGAGISVRVGGVSLEPHL